jgi:hypothetical protein
MQTVAEERTMNIKFRVEGQSMEEAKKQLQDIFNGANIEQKIDKRINEFEDI